MLAYAAQTRPAGRAGSPSSLVLILASHAVLIGAVMTAKMDLVPVTREPPPIVVNIPEVLPPPPEPTSELQPKTQTSFIDIPPKAVDMGQTTSIELDAGPTIRDIIPEIGPEVTLDPPRAPVRIAARINTPDYALKPPYPNDKLRAQEEATLKLRLTIDARGRVTAVEPVGAADPSFLAAARRHIIRSWRYRPATEDGVAVPYSTLINLSFRLEDV